MTHKELLENIDLTIKSDKRGTELYWAIRAVVELHKGSSQTIPCPDGIPGCCVVHYSFNSFCFGCNYLQPYPCPTIQAIEKELQ